MSANEFKIAWGENAVSALQLFITGLGDTERNGKSATVALKDLGITETRMQRMILSLANSGNLMNRTLETANKAWAENTALQAEAEKRYNTTESKITMLQNAWNNLKITIGDYVTPAFRGFADMTTDALVDMNDFIKGQKSLKEQMDLIASAADESALSIEITSGVADAYINRLQTLESQGLETTEALTEYHNILEQLCTTVPALAEFIDLETDGIIGGTEALLKNTAVWKENNLEQIYQNKYRAEMDAYAQKRTIELAEAQSRVNQRQAEHNIALAKEKEAYKALYEALNMTKDEYNALNETEKTNLKIRLTLKDKGPLFNKDKGKIVKDLSEATETVKQTSIALAQAKAAAEDAQKQLDNSNEIVAEAERLYKEFTESVDSQTNAFTEQKTSSEEVAKSISTVTDKIAELSAAYTESYNAALESIGGQYDIWDTAAQVVATSSYTINKALESQVTYWQRYNTNLAKLRERTGDIEGLNELIASFADGSAESVNAVAGMANASDSELAKMVTNWQQLQKEQKAAAENIADIEKDYKDTMEALKEELKGVIGEMDLTDDAAVRGKESIQSFIDGAEDMIPEVERAYMRIAGAAILAIDKQLKSSGYKGTINTFDQRYDILPAHASGTLNAEDVFLAGEYGPELIIGARGSTVFPASETQKIINAVADYQEYVNLAPLYEAMNTMRLDSAAVSAESSGG
ncbi:MAG: phage tail tape measure protein, partial [Papillibacter sp.]|nr:phage tail tape measure protein [Papillibacter sp.]